MKLKFQDKFYNIIDHNKCPSNEKKNQKCILRKSYFHQIQPNHNTVFSSSIIGEDYLSTLLYFTIIASCQLQHLQRNYPLFTKILLIGTASIVAIVHGNIV